MKGTGSRRGRLVVAMTVVRRLVVSMAGALAVVAVASRVNRAPMSPRVLAPTAADRMLAEVEVDPSRSLADGIELINRAAPGGVRIEWVNVKPEDWLARGWQEAGASLRLRDVRLGTAVALWARMRGEDGLEWRLEKDAVVIGGPGTASSDLVGRLYDVRDIRDEIEGWMGRLGPLAEAPLPGGGGLFGSSGRGGGLFGGSGGGPAPTMAQIKPVQSAAVDNLAMLIQESIDATQWSRAGGTWNIEAWGGWLYVRAPVEGHRAVERFLLLVRRGDSGPARPAGAGS